MAKIYTCARCGEDFVGLKTEEDAAKEYEEVFGGNFEEDVETLDVVCDDCYQKMIKRLPPEVWLQEQER